MDAFLKGEPIEEFLSEINDGTDKFNIWVYDNDVFQNLEYAILISEEEIFHTAEDIFDYFDRGELDLNTDEEILNFMNTKINEFYEHDAPSNGDNVIPFNRSL